MIYFIQHSKNMYIYSLDYTLFCGMKKHILKLAPFLNRCYWPGWITYSSIWLKRIETEFLPNSVLTKAEISHHSSSLCHTGSAVQFILISVFQLCLLMGYIKPFGFELALFPCKKISEQLKKKSFSPEKRIVRVTSGASMFVSHWFLTSIVFILPVQRCLLLIATASSSSWLLSLLHFITRI